MMIFNVGQRVVCVRRDRHFADPNPHLNPKKGGIYTVANVYFTDDDEAVLMLELMELRWSAPGWWPGFMAYIFRPIVERKTDILVFRALLIPTRPKVLVDS